MTNKYPTFCVESRRHSRSVVHADFRDDRDRARFPRQVVFQEFRYRDARMLDLNGFQDRKPDDPPVFISDLRASAK